MASQLPCLECGAPAPTSSTGHRHLCADCAPPRYRALLAATLLGLRHYVAAGNAPAAGRKARVAVRYGRRLQEVL